MRCIFPFLPWQAQLGKVSTLSKQDRELSLQLRWVILARAVFSIVLIFSTLVFSNSEVGNIEPHAFWSLYKVGGGVLGLSLIYFFWLKSSRYIVGLAYLQTIADTCLVTAIVFITGCFNSVFTFLYLVVIIYSAMLLFLRGGFVVAVLSAFQYGLLIEMEYFRVIAPIPDGPPLAASVDESQIIYRIIITIAACFAVATLSGLLSLQLKTARQDLRITREHLKRVEKLAAVDEIISGIAHEIKNPLASLSGSIQMLREETKPGSDQDRLMQIILRETNRLEQIVNDIRLISKPGQTNSKAVDLPCAIEDVKLLFMNTPEWKNRIELVTDLKKQLTITIDPVHLQQILWNLVKNAADAITGQGKIYLTLDSPRNNRVYLTIRDTGKGIPPSDAPHIFDPFFTTKGDGTGLGLSIIHRIIDAYDGMIDFESIPGKGTVFTVIFKGTLSPKQQS